MTGLTISPDGQSVAWIAADAGSGRALYTLSLAPGSKPHGALYSTGKPERLESCSWVSNDRLVCSADWLHRDPLDGILPFSRMPRGQYRWLERPGAEHTVKRATRAVSHSATDRSSTGCRTWTARCSWRATTARTTTRGHSSAAIEEGLGVDQVDTRNLKSRSIEKPRRDAWQYITDGRGHVRIIGIGKLNGAGQDTGTIDYLYHPANSPDFRPLSTWNF